MTTRLMAITDKESWLEKRKAYVTATESASLFGLQMPSLPTAYELWHIKRGLIGNDIEINSRMLWGQRLEHAIAEGIAEDNDFELTPLDYFAYDDDDKIGSSFDYAIKCQEHGRALLEVKTTAYRDYKAKFIEDDESGFIEAPPYYEVQCQHELELLKEEQSHGRPKYDSICLAVFIMDTREVKLLWRERDKEFGAAIRSKVKDFWSSDEPPQPVLEKDSDLLARVHRANNNSSSLDATNDADFEVLCQTFLQENAKQKNAEKAKKIARSRIVLKMHENDTAWCNSARVSNKKKFLVTSTGEQ